MTNKNPNRITITDVVASVHCEQKTVFDATVGDRASKEIRIARHRGTQAHERFANEANQKTNQSDTRCFVASHLYGVHSEQANLLRSWRDNKLKPYWQGRLFISVYYSTSPYLVNHLSRSNSLTNLTRKALSSLIKRGWFNDVDTA